MRVFLTVPLLVLALSGCTNFIKFPSSEAPSVPSQWQSATSVNSQNLLDWWRTFDDPVLLDLISAASSQHPSVGIARSRIQEAWALLGSVQASRSALITGTLSATQSSDLNHNSPDVGSRQAGASLSWEADLFGAKSLSEAQSRVALTSREFELAGTELSLVAQTAQVYFDVQACRVQADILQEDLNSRTKVAVLTEILEKNGFKSRSELNLAVGSRLEAESGLSQKQTECAVLLKALSALTGKPENDVRSAVFGRTAAPLDVAPLTVTGVPADLLSRRPDLASAERQMQAAGLDVGIAKARSYPDLTLTGSAIITALSGGPTGFPALAGAAISHALYDGGRSQAQIDIATARYEQARHQYALTALTAVEEVERILATQDGLRRQLTTASDSALEYSQHFTATERQWREGLASLLDLENSRRLWLSARLAESSLKRESLRQNIQLYKALGGGWSAVTGDSSS